MSPLESFFRWVTSDAPESDAAQLKAALVAGAFFLVILLVQWAAS